MAHADGRRRGAPGAAVGEGPGRAFPPPTAGRAQTGAFVSAEDALRRIELPQRAWRTLAEAGAFDAFIQPRRQAIWTVLRMTRYTQFALPLGLPADAQVTQPEQTPLEQTAADYRTMGLSTGRHPVTYLRPQLSRRGVLRADQLLSLRDKQWVRVAGQVNTRQRPPSAKGFFFVTLEDETGFVNVIVRPQVFEAHRRVLVSAPFLYIEGVLGLEQGVANVQGRIFEELGFGEVVVPKARSFK